MKDSTATLDSLLSAEGSTDCHVVCFSQNADTSVKVQQAAVWEMMPKEFRKITKGIEGYINYSMQNGFTGSSFIFPDTRTRVDFKTYTQFSNNQTILEGFEFCFSKPGGLNLGAWLDEYLGDSALVNTLRFRLATRNSKLLIGFTPIDGFTPFISEYLKGAETLETREAELLNYKQVPVRQYSPDRDASVVYLHSDENPFGGYERIAKDLKGRSTEDIMVRAYGIPVKSMTSLLPLFSTEVNVDHPLSLYAATKKSNDLMAHCYSHLYQIPTTGLRFFTVYGPWGRPDMALFLFTKNIIEGKPIDIFNQGNHLRDFTYIDDIVEGIVRVHKSPPKEDLNWDSTKGNSSSSSAPYRVLNIGNNNPVKLEDNVEEIEKNPVCYTHLTLPAKA